MKKRMIFIGVLTSTFVALTGAMMATAMTGCVKNENSNAEVEETVTTIETTEIEVTEPVSETIAETEETTEEVAETTLSPEEQRLLDWKNSEYYFNGLSDLRDNADSLYAVHFLVGADAIKAYENGSFDEMTEGYDLMWKFGDEQYYARDFAKDMNLTIKPSSDISPDAYFDTDNENYRNLFWYKATELAFLQMTNQGKYDPFENGNAEYKENTVCLIWQKEEGTFDGAETFYYEISETNYTNITEIFLNLGKPNYYSETYINSIFEISEDIADMFKVESTGNSATDKSSEETTSEAEQGEETTSENANETTAE